MSAATDAVASAILNADTQADSLLPAVGVVRSLNVTRDDDGTIADMALTVTVNGVDFDGCGWSGAFALQVGSAVGSALVGRSVRVELVGGFLLVSDTVNWSVLE